MVYVLDGRDTPKYYTATVKDVSAPYFPQQKPGTFNPMPMQQFINISIDGNEPWGVPINLYVVSKDGLTVSMTRDGLMPTITAGHQDCINAINSFERNKTNLAAYEQILKDIDPGYAKTKEQEEEIKRLNGLVESLTARLEKIPTADDIKSLLSNMQTVKTAK